MELDGPFLIGDRTWTDAEPGTMSAVLAMRDVSNPSHHDGINKLADDLESELRARSMGHDRAAIQATPPIPAYTAFYKRFGQRYHVGLQLESVALKGKSLPRVAALVEAMFIAELRHGILTAGHDLDALTPPVTIAVGTGVEAFTMANGEPATVKPGDVYTAATEGVLSSIIAGPATLARIGPATTAVLFVVYALPGVERARVDAHLDEIEANIRLIAPKAITIDRVVATAGSAS